MESGCVSRTGQRWQVTGQRLFATLSRQRSRYYPSICADH
ncbi:hypothetical protein BURPS668_A0117 [Burkholderia pseudomallei 668]|nr:hypothetical protein BURPS668_A0117 [Burkholderia pseudomallei 668]